MKNRKIYVLIVALGLAMVWLGVLFTVELAQAQKGAPIPEQVAVSFDEAKQPGGEAPARAAGVNRGEAVKEAGTGFPLLLAGLGVVFVVGGATRFRQQYTKRA